MCKCGLAIEQFNVHTHIGRAIIGAMTKEEVIRHYGTQAAVALALGGMNQSTVSGWRDVPALRQLQIEALTGGALKADPSCDKYRVPVVHAAAEA